MKIKSFSAPTLQEALLKVRTEIGPSALILETRKYNGDGIKEPMGKEVIEVIAAAPSEISGTASISPPTSGEDKAKGFALEKTANDAGKENHNESDRWDEVLHNAEPPLKKLHTDLLNIRNSLQRVACTRTDGWPDAIREFYVNLRTQDVDDTLSRTLLDNVMKAQREGEQENPDIIKQCLKAKIAEALLAQKLPAKDAKTQAVISFIGPTGVGKTTTIAKLAAKYSVNTEEDVALITVDTYRIGGADQLKTYGDIMGVPVKVVFTPQELRNAVSQFANASIILIDTAGRSQFDATRIRALKGILQAVPQVETHLVVSATTRYSDAIEIFNRFGIIPLHRLVFTKIDETKTYGMILNLAIRTALPPSYLTNGQEVPDDIEEAKPGRIAELIVDGK
ncbi:MAG TPA: flagellar biosynthesis protein FlhF [Candidatus Brocadiia bacterium]|nr:flagellar biosynthesis protein FlhF [Candidatus Brocadiales bacterium]